MKRAVGFLTMLLVLRLSLAGSDFVCAKHGVAQAQGGPTAHAAMHHGGDRTGNQNEHQTPVMPDCCGAITSCSTTIALSSVVSFAAAPLLVAGPSSDSTLSPPSRIVAPETPPPRA